MMKVDPNDTALVVTDPQNDFLSRQGFTWGMVGEAVRQRTFSPKIVALLWSHC